MMLADSIDEGILLDTLRAMQVPCRSNYNGIFTDKARLQAIQAELADSPFSNVFHGLNCDIYTKYGRKNFKDRDILLISSHVDVVRSIHVLFSIQDDERRLLSGTFDNTITNAACVYLMAQMELPDSVVFAFTADEETGKCRGAKRALQFLTDNGADASKISVLSLDVTYEGFNEKCGFTLENLDCKEEYSYSTIAEFANETDNPYIFASPDYHYPENVPANYCSPRHSWFDEGAAYAGFENLLESGSLCMPVHTRPGHNDMHTDYGILAHTDSFLTYTKVLGAYAKDYLNERKRLLAKLEATYPPRSGGDYETGYADQAGEQLSFEDLLYYGDELEAPFL